MNGYWKNNHAVYIVAHGKPVPRQVQLNLQGDSTAQVKYIDGQRVPIVDITMLPSDSQAVIGPFMTPGTYSFFDPIQLTARGNLTVVVQ